MAISVLLHGAILLICTKLATPITSSNATAPASPIASRVYINYAPTVPPPNPEASAPKQRVQPQLLTPLESPLLLPLKPAPITPPDLAPQDPPAVRYDNFGERTGTDRATAMQSLSGDKPMEAPKGEQDQPYISRDPSETHRLPDQPAKADGGMAVEGMPGDAGVQQTADRVHAVPKPPDDVPLSQPAVAVATGHRSSSIPGPHTTLATRPSQSEVLASAQPATRPLHDRVVEPGAVTVARVGFPNAAKSPTSPADPVPASDSESDPFSVDGAAVFRPGRVTAIFGRKVTTVRPRLSLAGQYDLLSLPVPQVVLSVRADETGKVIDVAVKKSSGSKDVDQPCKLAMYDWWFEPPRDPKGRPKGCEMTWTISFRVR